MYTFVEFPCPYCHKQITRMVDKDCEEVIVHEPEDGGCNGKFYAAYDTVTTVEQIVLIKPPDKE